MSITMTRVRRAGLGIVVAAFSVGVVATSSSGASLEIGSGAHVISACHAWGS